MSRLFVVGAVLAALAWAQSPRGSIIGRVTDASTSSLGGASVIIENTRTGSSSSVATAPEGEYTVPSLDPGVYRVTVSASGFKTKIMNEVVLNVSQTVRVDVVLDVGEITTKVEVTASVPVVQTDSSAVANVVDGRQVNAMPLNGRQNLYGLLALSPGVQGAGQNPLIAGSGGFGAVDLRIDGVSGNDHGNERNLQTVPSLESIAEFKVLANGGSAEFGRGGAQIIVATKGGTNEFHGSLIYFNRNRVTAANNFFSNRAGLPRPKFNRNEYGGSLGGPIRKNKLFFFGNFEGFRQTASATITTQMPTVALRNGDFTGLARIRDPFNGGVPFPDNRIPPNRISSVPKGLIDSSPTPIPLRRLPRGSAIISRPTSRRWNHLIGIPGASITTLASRIESRAAISGPPMGPSTRPAAHPISSGTGAGGEMTLTMCSRLTRVSSIRP